MKRKEQSSVEQVQKQYYSKNFKNMELQESLGMD